MLGAAALGALAQSVVVLVAANYVGVAMVLVVAVFYLVQRSYLRMQRILRDEFGGPGWTWLVVAHRVATVLDFDKVAVLSAAG